MIVVYFIWSTHEICITRLLYHTNVLLHTTDNEGGHCQSLVYPDYDHVVSSRLGTFKVQSDFIMIVLLAFCQL